ncbi:amidohydrolase [Taklimakanibacter lacteus]|uniref:amidohydrolase n=1 Tax=Taklimakanibacter lacteus TaxID=2268456 RepID=UPI000E673B41
MTETAYETASAFVDQRQGDWSQWNAHIWNLAETAWREYRSAEWYVARLKAEGFSVETGSGGMPTAFSGTWSNGKGPAVMAYAEYDAVPGNCQIADTYRSPRKGLSRFAGGHTDPHSALGMGALVGALAAKAAMQKHGIQGTIRFMGEPAEKVRGSKPIHAARGYYDGLDAIISFHPFYMLPYCNTCRWDTHCGPYYAAIYEFLCEAPETWLRDAAKGPIPAAHTSARAPGANDAVVAMYTLSKMMRDHMLPHTGTWTLNETILASGQATADNLAAQMAQILFAARTPDRAMLENIFAVLDRNAESAALAAHCSWRRHWVSKSRPGLANHAMAEITYRNLERAGPPRFGADAVTVAQAIQRELGLSPMARPFIDEIEQLITPQEAERKIRATIPAWQTHYTSDDYTDMTWHAPTVRFYIGRATLKAPQGFAYPDWVMNALGGIPATIDPTVATAARTIAGTMLDLLTDKEMLRRTRTEYEERLACDGETKPWCDYAPPLDFPWPDYVETPRGREWWIPATADDRALHRPA